MNIGHGGELLGVRRRRRSAAAFCWAIPQPDTSAMSRVVERWWGWGELRGYSFWRNELLLRCDDGVALLGQSFALWRRRRRTSVSGK